MLIPKTEFCWSSLISIKNHAESNKFVTDLFQTYNLGTGQGYSVLELIDNFEKATKTKIPYKIVERRLGDIEQIYADVRLAKEELKWETKYSMKEMCEYKAHYFVEKFLNDLS